MKTTNLEHLCAFSEKMIDGLKSKVYEKFVLSLMNASESVFPHKYEYIEQQSHGECDFIDIATKEKFDAKLPLERKQVEFLTKGKQHAPDYSKWIQELQSELSELNMKSIQSGEFKITSTKLYQIMKEEIKKDKSDENIIFFFPFPVAPTYPGAVFLIHATDFPSMVFHQLEKEGELDFSQRSIYEIYPSPIKSTYALKNLAKPGVDFVENLSFDKYFMHEIIVLD